VKVRISLDMCYMLLSNLTVAQTRTQTLRNAFHCLCQVHTMSDAHSKSQVFSILKVRFRVRFRVRVRVRDRVRVLRLLQ
jgi:hypothetical protein